MSGDPQDAAPSKSVDALTDASPTSASAGGAAAPGGEAATEALEILRAATWGPSHQGDQTQNRWRHRKDCEVCAALDSLARSLAEREQQVADAIDHDALAARLEAAEADNARWLAWSGGQYPDDSPGDVIAADADGTITLDDAITTWNPLRALAFLAAVRGER